MTTAAKLKTMTVKDLGNLAKECGIVGWHDKRKDELIQAIYRKHRSDKERLRRQKNRQSAVETTPVQDVVETTSVQDVAETTPVQDVDVSSKTTDSVVSPTKKTATKTKAVKTVAQAVKPKTPTAAVVPETVVPAVVVPETVVTAVVVPETVVPAVVIQSGPKETATAHKERSTPVEKTTSSPVKSAKVAVVKTSPTKKPAAKPDVIPSQGVPAAKPTTSTTQPSGGVQGTATSKTATTPKPTTATMTGVSGISLQPTLPQNDQVVLMVRDPYWLHLFWRLSQKGMDRAKAALSHFWHTSVPVLRVFRLISDGISNPRKEFLRDIRVHNRVSHWYIDVHDPPSNFQVEVGYLTREGNFFPVAASNIVETPLHHVTDNPDQLDGNWLDVAQDFERIIKMSGGFDGNNREMRAILEEQLRRPLSSSLIARAAAKPKTGERTRNFSFQIQADLIIHGRTDPTVQLSVRGEPITVAKDGSFAVRYGMAEKRHVYPVQAMTRDGSESQIIVLTVDRNTKILETVFQEIAAED